MARKNLKKPKKIVDSLVKATFVTLGMLLFAAVAVFLIYVGGFVIQALLQGVFKIDPAQAEKFSELLAVLTAFFGLMFVMAYLNDGDTK